MVPLGDRFLQLVLKHLVFVVQLDKKGLVDILDVFAGCVSRGGGKVLF